MTSEMSGFNVELDFITSLSDELGRSCTSTQLAQTLGTDFPSWLIECNESVSLLRATPFIPKFMMQVEG